MTRPRNPLTGTQERFTANRLIRSYLEDLVQTGLYGRLPGEAAERLVSQGIERLIEKGVLTRKPVRGPSTSAWPDPGRADDT
jgi:hypothetical protein